MCKGKHEYVAEFHVREKASFGPSQYVYPTFQKAAAHIMIIRKQGNQRAIRPKLNRKYKTVGRSFAKIVRKCL